MKRRILSERGASYSLPVVLIFPLYLTFVLVAFEMGLLELQRFSVQMAASQSARAAVAWHGMTDDDAVQIHSERAAWRVMVSTVGNRSSDLVDAGPVPKDAVDLSKSYGETFSNVLAQRGQSTTTDSLSQRYQNAAARTTVRIEYLENAIRVTVSYRAKLALPGASRFLLPDGATADDYPLSATVTLPKEPHNPNRFYEPNLTKRGNSP